jgi:hypothetical protein
MEIIFFNIPDTVKIQTAVLTLYQYLSRDKYSLLHTPSETLWCIFNKKTVKGMKWKSLKQCAHFYKYDSCNKSNFCILEVCFRSYFRRMQWSQESECKQKCAWHCLVNVHRKYLCQKKKIHVNVLTSVSQFNEEYCMTEFFEHCYHKHRRWFAKWRTGTNWNKMLRHSLELEKFKS